MDTPPVPGHVPAATAPVLSCTGIVPQHTYWTHPANFTFVAGDIVIVTGGRRTGKTALLQALGGRQLPVRGALQFYGACPKTAPAKLLNAQGAAGYVPAVDAAPSRLSVEEVLGGAVQCKPPPRHSACSSLLECPSHVLPPDDDDDEGCAATVQARRYRAALHHAGLSKAHLTRKVNTLCPVEMKQLSIAVQLLTAPCVLLLDEPTLAMGIPSAHIIHSVIRKIAAAGVAVVIAARQPKQIELASCTALIYIAAGVGPVLAAPPRAIRAAVRCPPYCNIVEYLDHLNTALPATPLCPNMLQTRSTPVEEDSPPETLYVPSHRNAICSSIQIFCTLFMRTTKSIIRTPATCICMPLVVALQGILLGLMYMQITSNVKGYSAFELVLPPFSVGSFTLDPKELLKEWVPIWTSGVDGNGTRPLVAVLEDGVDGRGSTPLLQLASNAKLISWVNDTFDCLYSAYQIPDASPVYPPHKFMEPGRRRLQLKNHVWSADDTTGNKHFKNNDSAAKSLPLEGTTGGDVQDLSVYFTKDFWDIVKDMFIGVPPSSGDVLKSYFGCGTTGSGGGSSSECGVGGERGNSRDAIFATRYFAAMLNDRLAIGGTHVATTVAAGTATAHAAARGSSAGGGVESSGGRKLFGAAHRSAAVVRTLDDAVVGGAAAQAADSTTTAPATGAPATALYRPWSTVATLVTGLQLLDFMFFRQDYTEAKACIAKHSGNPIALLTCLEMHVRPLVQPLFNCLDVPNPLEGAAGVSNTGHPTADINNAATTSATTSSSKSSSSNNTSSSASPTSSTYSSGRRLIAGGFAYPSGDSHPLANLPSDVAPLVDALTRWGGYVGECTLPVCGYIATVALGLLTELQQLIISVLSCLGVTLCLYTATAVVASTGYDEFLTLPAELLGTNMERRSCYFGGGGWAAARFLAHLPTQVLNILIFATMYGVVGGILQTLDYNTAVQVVSYYGVQVSVAVAMVLLAYLVVVVVLRGYLAMITGAAVFIILLVLGGALYRTQDIPRGVRWLHTISPYANGLYALESTYFAPLDKTNGWFGNLANTLVLSLAGVGETRVWVPVLYNLAFALGCGAIAVVLLVLGLHGHAGTH